MAKSRAVGYTNFYNGNTDKAPNLGTTKPSTVTDENEATEKLKKEALKRRLMRVTKMKKAKKEGF